jgi:hypothetical protein
MKSLTCAAITTLIVSVVSKSPTFTWQGTHYEFIKLITRANVLCLDLDIHKSKDDVAVTQDYRARITYSFMVLETNVGMAN